MNELCDYLKNPNEYIFKKFRDYLAEHKEKTELGTFVNFIEQFKECPNLNYFFKEAKEKLSAEDYFCLFEILAGDTEWRLRSTIAGNPKTPDVIIQRLMEDEEKMVRNAAIANPKNIERVLKNIKIT